MADFERPPKPWRDLTIEERRAYVAKVVGTVGGTEATAAPVAVVESTAEKDKGDAASKKAAARRAAARKARPKPAPPLEHYEHSRRQFGFIFAGGLVALFAGIGQMLAIFGRFMMPNVLYEPPTTVPIGKRDDYQSETVETKFKKKGFWVVNHAATLYALQAICTHLGCPPNWLASDQKFKCPCHGSGFRISGINFEGPAPRPLERFRIYEEDGELIVDKSVKFQQEKGEWEKSGAFLPLA